jgi:hypothetical protein
MRCAFPPYGLICSQRVTIRRVPTLVPKLELGRKVAFSGQSLGTRMKSRLSASVKLFRKLRASRLFNLSPLTLTLSPHGERGTKGKNFWQSL